MLFTDRTTNLALTVSTDKHLRYWKGSLNAAIIDFRPNSAEEIDIKHFLSTSYPCVKWKPLFDMCVSRGHPGFISTMLNYLESWKIEEMMDETVAHTLDEISRLVERGTLFTSQRPMEEVKTLGDQVKLNSTQLRSTLMKLSTSQP